MRYIPPSVGLVIALVAAGCKQQADVDITGTIRGMQAGDSVFVTLSRTWDRGTVAPTLFNYDAEGRFELRFAIGGAPPPICFVKNRVLLAELDFRKAGSYAPLLVDNASGAEFPVTVVAEGVLKAQVVVGK